MIPICPPPWTSGYYNIADWKSPEISGDGSHRIFQDLYWFSLFWTCLSWKDRGDVCPILPVLSMAAPPRLPTLLQAGPTLSLLPRELHLATGFCRIIHPRRTLSAFYTQPALTICCSFVCKVIANTELTNPKLFTP